MSEKAKSMFAAGHIEPAVSAGEIALARQAMIAEAYENGGRIVRAECPACESQVHGLVVFDAGESATETSRPVPAHWYVVAYVRSCNCNVDRKVTEDSLLAAICEEAA